VASPAYEQILKVQAVDLQLTQLRHQHDHHPARRSLAEAEQEVAAVARDLQSIDDRRHQLDRDRKRLEDEAALLVDKRTGIDRKLYGGEVTASKELLALQDEAAMLKTRQDEVEDRELEFMEQLEAIDGERAALEDRQSKAESELSGLRGRLDEALSGLDAEIEAAEANRAALAADADPVLLARYGELRGQYGGVPVARLVNGACDGCHIHLSAMAVDQITKLPDDAVVTCEECGRLLVH
jgi:predicted  nucleic acid-binding Zn-ribbon protein